MTDSLPKVYLSGPITGLFCEMVVGWRRTVRAALEGRAEIIDPTRDEYDIIRQSDHATEPSAERMEHGKRTVARNRFDLKRCDLVFACFLGAQAVSIGAVGEIFWADSLGKPVIVVREAGNIHDHDMLNHLAGWIYEDLDAAIEQVKTLLELG